MTVGMQKFCQNVGLRFPACGPVMWMAVCTAVRFFAEVELCVVAAETYLTTVWQGRLLAIQ